MKWIAFKIPSLCLSPQGERGRPNCSHSSIERPQRAPSPVGVREDFSRAVGYVTLTALLLAGCDLSMTEQPKYTPESPSKFWANGTSARPIPANTVAQGDLAREAAAKNPPEVTLALLSRGQQRFDMFCTPCHGLSGYGDGMIVQRGFPHPPSLHTQRLRAADVRYFYNVQTKGFGVMYSYAGSRFRG